MANTYITSGTRFRPYTFAEMLQPVQLYTEAYDEVENELSNLDIMAADIAGKLSNPKDKKLKDLYNNFNTELENAFTSLYSDGLNSQTRRKLNTLKAQYTEHINPINEAYKSYQEDQKYWTKIAMEHPEYIIERGDLSIADYMHGNTPGGRTANTEDIYNKALKATAGASGRFSKILGPTGILGNQYYQYKTQQGISQDIVEDIRYVIDNPKSREAKEFLSTEEGRALYDIVQERRRVSNYDSFSTTGKNRIDASIISGIFAGASYKEDTDRVSNKDWKSTSDTPPPPSSPKDINLFSRPIPRARADKEIKTTELKKEKDLINHIITQLESGNVNILDTYTDEMKGVIYQGYSTTGTPVYKTYAEKLEELRQKYNMNVNVSYDTDDKGNVSNMRHNLENFGPVLDDLIKDAATVERDYVLNMTDHSLANKMLKENITAFASKTGDSGLKDEYGSPIKAKHVDEYLTEDSFIMVDPTKGILLVTPEEGRKVAKIAIVDPMLLDGSGVMSADINLLKKAIEEENYYNAAKIINGYIDEGVMYSGIMERLYNLFNTIPTTQSKTSSKPINP